MKRFLKWALIVVLSLGAVAFLAFLYFIPPFTLAAPEEFSGPVASYGPPLSEIADPGVRAMAERGRYLVTLGSCSDCHSTPGPQGPRAADMYLAGGAKMTRRHAGTYVSVNLTSDRETGLGSYSDEEINRALRSGVSKSGRSIPGHLMPWPGYSNWTDEDLHAVVVYLRQTKAISHRIPQPVPPAFTDPAAVEEDYAGRDYAVSPP